MKKTTSVPFHRSLLLAAGVMMLSLGFTAAAADSELEALLDKAAESRAKMLAEVEQKMDEASELRDKKQYAQADAVLQEQLKKLAPVNGSNMGSAAAGQFEDLQDEISDLHREWGRHIMNRARKTAGEKRYADAMLIAAEAVVVDKNLAGEAKAFNEKCQKLAKSENYRTETQIDNFDKGFSANQEKIALLIQEAKTFYANKRYNEARNSLEQVFLLDPYNTQAISFLSVVYNQLYTAGQARRNAEVAGISAAAEWSWSEPVSPAGLDTTESRRIEAKTSSPESIYSRMEQIIIPQFAFNGYNITKVVSKLNELAKENDPEKRGINIILGLDSDKASKLNVSMNLLQMPLKDLLRYLSLETGLKYRVESDSNSIVIGTSELQSASFPVRGDLIAGILASAPAGDSGEAAVPGQPAAPAENKSSGASSAALKSYFQARGIEFGDGATIAYDRRTNEITVQNTMKNIQRMDELLKKINAIETPLVLVEVKMVEITETDFDELGFRWSFDITKDVVKTADGWGYYSDSHPVVIADSAGWNPVGGYTDTSKNTDQVYNTGANLLNGLKIFPNFGTGIIKDMEMNLSLSINALCQNGRAEMLSAPKLVTAGGEEAMVKMITKRYFPVSWESPEIESDDENTDITYPVPEWSDPTEVGIHLKVRPEVDPDNHTISLELHPEIITFIGKTDDAVLMDYGVYQKDGNDIPYKQSYVTNTKQDPTDPRLNVSVWMPIIGRRKADVFAKVHDGQTIVIGGMVENTTNTSRDRWPLLGDLPFIGRFFSGEAKNVVKKNLLIFVTARLVDNAGMPLNRNETSIPDFNR